MKKDVRKQSLSLTESEGESVSHSVMSNSATPWYVACQALLSMGFSRQEYWSRLPFPSPGGLPDPGTELRFPALQADSLPSEPPGKPRCWCVMLGKQYPSVTQLHQM